MVVGFDATDDAVASVNAGEMAATVAQQPTLNWINWCWKQQLKALNEEKVEASIPVALSLVIK